MSETLDKNDEPQKKLSIKEVAQLVRLKNHLNEIADNIIGEPIDPKVSSLLQMAADMIEEQINMDKYYSWEDFSCGRPLDKGGKEEPKYQFLDNDEDDKENEEVVEKTTPTATELKQWFSGGAVEDGSSE